MAPSNRQDHKNEELMMNDVFGNVEYTSNVPEHYLAFKKAERDHGMKLQVECTRPGLHISFNS